MNHLFLWALGNFPPRRLRTGEVGPAEREALGANLNHHDTRTQTPTLKHPVYVFEQRTEFCYRLDGVIRRNTRL